MEPNPLSPDEEERLLRVAVAISDGTPIDWASTPPEALTSLLGINLQQVERIVRGHAALHPAERGMLSGFDSADETVLTAARRAARDAPDDHLRVEWGPLVVLEKIGRGSFGDVYRALDPKLEREVALKLVRDIPGLAATSAFDEGRLLARVRHPNVVTIYGAERIDGRVGIWMEFVRGRTLADEVQESGPLGPEDAARIGVEVCRALGAVHAAGLLHRDVKAHNVMRDDGGRIVLGDFGTGVEFDDNAAVAEPQVAGTPLYLAPEIFEGRPASIASDVYSVGVLLYFLTTGQHPVHGRTFGEVKRAHQHRKRSRLGEAKPDLPAEFVRVVDALLEPGPDRRYGTAASAEAALAKCCASVTYPETPIRSTKPGKWLLAGAAVVTTVLLAALVPGLRGAVASRWRGSAFLLGVPVSRQIPNRPCSGAPSADGKWIACVESPQRMRDRGARSPALVLFNVDTGTTTLLKEPNNTERISSAVISADGSSVAFTTMSAGKPNEIRTIDSSGRSEKLIAVADDALMVFLAGWSPHDGKIAARVIRRAGGPQALALITPASGSLEIVFEFPMPPQYFSRSPDGNLLAFDTLQSPGSPERDIRVCDLRTSTCETTVAHPANDSSAVWAPNGRLLFISDRAGTMGLWAVALDGLRQAASPELLRDSGRGRISPVGFADDGSFFYDLWIDEFDVYSATLEGAPSEEPTPVRLSPRAVDANRSPVWSPDGRLLAYVSRRGPFAEAGAMRVVIQSVADRTEREFRYDLRPHMNRLAWSPDGKILAMRALKDGVPPKGVFGIHLLDVQDGRVITALRRQNPPERFIEDQISDIGWTDEGTILFASKGGLGAFEVSSGSERRVWEAPPGVVVHGMAISPDREWAAVVVSPEGDQPAWFAASVVPAGGGDAREVLRVASPEGIWMQSWTADGESVLVTRWGSSPPAAGGRLQLWRVAANGSAATPLPLTLAGLDEVKTHVDGRRIAFSAGYPRSDLWITTELGR